MFTKNKPCQFDAHEMALDDEPMFTLLARDPSAPMVVERWAYNRRLAVDAGFAPMSDLAKADAADECAQAMRQWREANFGKWKQTPLLDTAHSEKPAEITVAQTYEVGTQQPIRRTASIADDGSISISPTLKPAATPSGLTPDGATETNGW